MDTIDEILKSASEFVNDRLYFATLHFKPESTEDIQFFNIDDQLIYNNFNLDFGPLDLACLFRYCTELNAMMKSSANATKKIVHYTSGNPQKRANAACLIGSFGIIYLQKTPKEAYNLLTAGPQPPFLPFRDLAPGKCFYTITMLDCFRGVHKAVANKLLDFETFNVHLYEQGARNRDLKLNWISPTTMLAFCGPNIKHKCCHYFPHCYNRINSALACR